MVSAGAMCLDRIAMAYTEDVRALERLEKYRVLALVVAIGLLIVSIVLELDWLAWPRAFAWSAAGVVSLLESRVLKRMGRSPDAAYLRAVLFFLVAVLCLV